MADWEATLVLDSTMTMAQPQRVYLIAFAPLEDHDLAYHPAAHLKQLVPASDLVPIAERVCVLFGFAKQVFVLRTGAAQGVVPVSVSLLLQRARQRSPLPGRLLA